MINHVLFVEGDDDVCFFGDLLRHLGITNVEIDQVRGNVERIPSVVPRIRQRAAEGKLVTVVLDMDESARGYVQLMSEYVAKYSLPIADWFLIPNNESEGDLETLLLQMTVAQHGHVERCFNEYIECLKLCSYSVPDRKGRVYAYCEALGVKAKGSERDYTDRESWNLDAVALDPLKEFLREFSKS